ncbi:MAG: type II toxin-antitoxin system ParD family antitoxin [Planctomycetota bacterium]
MNVNLSPELEKLVQDKVRSGLYASQSEVVREALRLLVEHDEARLAHLERIREGVVQGIREADRGEFLDGADVIREMRALLNDRRAERA